MQTKPDFLLIGDSHAGAIGRAARELKIGFAGGPLGSGRDFFQPFSSLEESSLRFRSADAQKHFEKALADCGQLDLRGLSIPVISTLGLSPHIPATREIWEHAREMDGEIPAGFFRSELFKEMIRAIAKPACQVHAHLVDMGCRLYLVTAPQRAGDLADPSVYRQVQNALLDCHRETGAEIVDLRSQTSGDDGWLHPDYIPAGDPLHATPDYGKIVLERIGIIP